MVPEDLAWLVDRLPGLRLCLDVSHAQLVVNARQGRAEPGRDWSHLQAFLHAFAPLEGVDDFVDRLAPWIFSVHVSNASGVMGEGLPYGQGDLQLDPLIRRLGAIARYIVTETLEPDPDHARLMREAQARISAVLQAAHA
jgi:hypothetical protein